MSARPTNSRVEEVLPGQWWVGASNLLFWLDGRHGDARFTIEVASRSPLRLTEEIAFNAADGQPRTKRGTARARDDGVFVWRGLGRELLAERRWVPVGIDETGSIVVVRYLRSRRAPAGMTVFVRDGGPTQELRARIAATAGELGITAEDFASLTWLR